ncbi:hypothetical protein FRC07_002569 [Ceratobasidium sp. 392]|nr:hypothetical protein FRC07_002569 [Ceratobasidium sp. 392]
MSRTGIKVEVTLLDENSPQILDINVVDRAILNQEDVDYILGSLPPVSMARVDADAYKPFLGIDMFYDEEASLKGVVFVFESRALAVRFPANIAKTSAKAYEQEKAAAETTAAKKQGAKAKGRPIKAANPRLAYQEHLRKLFQSDLAAFGMAQISLTLWHFLREKVGGVNLSTATTEAIPPPKRTLPEPKSEDGSQPNPGTQKDSQTDAPNGRGGKGGSRKKRGRGGAGDARKDSRPNKSPENPTNKSDSNTQPPVILPDDEPLNWDREISSPGDVVKKIYPKSSRIEVDQSFIGSDAELDLQARIAEAATRAWVSSLVAHELNTKVQNAPTIQPARLNDKELTFFAESMVMKWKVMGETAPVRKLQLEHFEEEDGMLVSKNYETKLRAGRNAARQYIMYTIDGVEKRLFLQRPGDSRKMKHTYLAEDEDEKPEPPSKQRPDGGRGTSASGRGRGSYQRRQGQVRDYAEDTSDIQGPDSSSSPLAPKKMGASLPKDVEASIVGREEATRVDQERDSFILRLLEGRGSLHGPKYKDCAFIRRVWFPTQAQLRIGEERKAKNTKKVRGKYDWIDDDWDDDTDEEEVARMNALILADGEEDINDETEDESVGQEDPKRGVKLPKEILLNPSQLGVIGRVVAPNPRDRTRATLVHGPPGTGKTSTIAAAVMILAAVEEPVWIVAQSNVGIKNVAEKLKDVGFNEFTLLVAKDYHTYWEARYENLKDRFFPTPKLKSEHYQNRVFESKAVLCTLATLSSAILDDKGIFIKRPLKHLIIDEASQIDMTSEFMHLFYKHRNTLKSVCWFGDPKQLPPYGWSEGTEIQDIFKVEHLHANSRLLDTSYRLPVPIAKYISRAVYESNLKEFKQHKVQLPQKAIVFVDVVDGQEEIVPGTTTTRNMAEVEVVMEIIQTYYERSVQQDWQDEEEPLEYDIITPYEGQRAEVERRIEVAGFKKPDGTKRQAYNVDSFQGNEADYIITTIAKTGGRGFLSSINRLNVLLTRCKRGLVIVTQKDFVQRAGGLLQGLWFSVEPYDPWVSAEDVLGGYVDLPGSPAPNTRPPTPEAAPSAPISRTNLPPRPGSSVQPSAANVVRQGMQPTAESPTRPVRGPWGQTQGVDRVRNPWGRAAGTKSESKSLEASANN